MGRRRAGLQRRDAIGDCGQRIVIHQHHGGGVFRHVTVGGDDDRDGLADVNDFVVRKNGAIELLPKCGARQRNAQLVFGDVGENVRSRPDRQHAGQRARGLAID